MGEREKFTANREAKEQMVREDWECGGERERKREREREREPVK